MDQHARIFVTGHRGLVGSAIVRNLQSDGYSRVLTATRKEVDLRQPLAVDRWFAANRPEYVIHVAGTVGGILANKTRPADFLFDNQMIQATVLSAAHRFGVEKLLYLGSSCIYPRECSQPIREEYLLTGPLEPTNQAYAIAKIGGLLGCQAYRTQHGCNFISAMPTNLYGPNDNFDEQSGHVLPALMNKFHRARSIYDKRVPVWGSGTPRREFLHVDDLAAACVFLMRNYDGEQWLNIGTGEDVSIRELAELVRDTVCPDAELVWDASKPDGTPRKLLDVSRLHELGWRHTTSLEDGVRSTYAWFTEQKRNAA